MAGGGKRATDVLSVLFIGLILIAPELSAEPALVEVAPEDRVLRLSRASVYAIHEAGRPPRLDAATLAAFQPIDASSLNLGLEPREVWTHSRLLNTAAERRDLILAAATVDTRCVAFTRESGDALRRLDDWESETWISSYAVRLPPGEPVDLFLRCRATGNLVADLDLFDPRDYQRQDRRIWAVNAFFHGGMLVLFMYNLFLLISTRESGYFDYLGFMACTMGFQGSLDGTAWTLLLNDWQNYYLAILSASLAPIFLIRFSRQLLDTALSMPRWDRVLYFLLFAYGGLAFIAPFADAGILENLMAPLVLSYPLLLFFTGLSSLRHYRSVALVYLTGLGLSLTSFAIVVIHLLGYDLIDPRIVQGKDLMKAGALAEGCLLAFALGIKLNRYRDELIESEKQHAAQLETRVMDRTRELRQANATKDQFLQIIAHDLRGPVGTTAVVLEEFVREAGAPDPDLLNELYASARSTATLLEDLLQWSQIQTGRLRARPENVRVSDELATTHALTAPTARGKNIKIEIENSHDLWVLADPLMLRGILRNLVGNAVKFTRPGGLIRIIADDNTANEIRFTIQDNGIGIDRTRARKLFEFGAMGEPGTAGERGSGLGLALCREFVSACGGRIGAGENPAGGSEFWFTLPRGKPAIAPEKFVHLDERLARLKVLVAEDHPLHARSTVRVLQELKVTPVLVPDGTVALERYANESFGLALLDIDMPNMDGIECCRRLRAQAAKLPIFALSAYDQDELQDRLSGVRFDAYLSRPLKESELRAALVSYLQAK